MVLQPDMALSLGALSPSDVFILTFLRASDCGAGCMRAPGPWIRWEIKVAADRDRLF